MILVGARAKDRLKITIVKACDFQPPDIDSNDMDASAHYHHHYRGNSCLCSCTQVQSRAAEDLVVVSFTMARETTHGKLSKEQTSENREKVTHVERHNSQHAMENQYLI